MNIFAKTSSLCDTLRSLKLRGFCFSMKWLQISSDCNLFTLMGWACFRDVMVQM